MSDEQKERRKKDHHFFLEQVGGAPKNIWHRDPEFLNPREFRSPTKNSPPQLQILQVPESHVLEGLGALSLQDL